MDKKLNKKGNKYVFFVVTMMLLTSFIAFYSTGSVFTEKLYEIKDVKGDLDFWDYTLTFGATMIEVVKAYLINMTSPYGFMIGTFAMIVILMVFISIIRGVSTE